MMIEGYLVYSFDNKSLGVMLDDGSEEVVIINSGDHFLVTGLSEWKPVKSSSKKPYVLHDVDWYLGKFTDMGRRKSVCLYVSVEKVVPIRHGDDYINNDVGKEEEECKR